MATTLAPPTPKLTYADLDVVPTAREGDRQELFDGELVVTASPVPDHQAVVLRAGRRFAEHVEVDDLGDVFMAPIDVVFAASAVAVPDLVFVRNERREIITANAIVGTPDLIVEVLSPSTRRRDLGRKKGMYERFGVPEYWVIDLDARAVTVFVLRDGRYATVPHDGVVVRSTVLPAFEIRIADLFVRLSGSRQ